MVAVTNRRPDVWSVDQVGRPGSSLKRTNSTPVATGRFPTAQPAQAGLASGRAAASQTNLATKRAGAASPTPRSVVSAKRAPTPTNRDGATTLTAASAVSRSNTVKSAASNGTAKSGGVKPKRTRQTGALARNTLGDQSASEGRTIMSLVDMTAPPVMPDVPKAPKSQVTPQMEQAKAPGSAIVRPETPQQFPKAAPKIQVNGDELRPSDSISVRRVPSRQSNRADDEPASTRLPSSKSLSRPLKSALRPSAGSPPSLAPPVDVGPMYTVSAPGPVHLETEKSAGPTFPAALHATRPKSPASLVRPRSIARPSALSVSPSDAPSVYESAMGGDDDARPADGDSSSEEEEESGKGYTVYVNETAARAGEAAAPPRVERFASDHYGHNDDEVEYGSEASEDTVPAERSASRASRQKSVRMAVPDSPASPAPMQDVKAPGPLLESNAGRPGQDRIPSPAPAKVQEKWDTRIGRIRDDDSEYEEEEVDEGEYDSARNDLMRNTGRFDGAAAAPETKNVKSKGSLASKVKKAVGRI